MKISVQEEYGVRCLVQLARSRAKLTIGEIAAAEGLSLENAAKIMARLRTLGVVQSLRGKEGGYLLAREPEEIRVAEVMEGMTGGLFEFDRCSGPSEGATCVHHSDCGLRPVWFHLGAMVHAFLASITIADLLESSERSVHDRIGRLASRLSSPRALAAGKRLPASSATDSM